jgi:hypothetical protein
MTGVISLVPLLCTRCQAAIPAQPDEVAWICSQCGQGLLLSEEHGTIPLSIHFALSPAPPHPGKPFWVALGQAATQRRIYGGNDQSREAALFWAEPRRFFIPAFNLPLEQLVDLGTRLLLQPPGLQEGPVTPFLPVNLHPDDIQSAAEFIILGVEASRKDKLKEVGITVRLDQPELWIFP